MRRISLLPLIAAVCVGRAVFGGSPAEEFIPWLLEGTEQMKQVPFAEVIRSSTGKQVLAIRREDETDQRVLKEIGAALDAVLREMSAPTSAVQSYARINEVSSRFEDALRAQLNRVEGLVCDFPADIGRRSAACRLSRFATDR